MASQTPVRLAVRVSAQTFSHISPTGWLGPSSVTLLKATSTVPCRRTVSATMYSAPSSPRPEGSATTRSALPPCRAISSQVLARVSGCRPATTTVAPSPAKATDAARPIPSPPPVTRTIWPANRDAIEVPLSFLFTSLVAFHTETAVDFPSTAINGRASCQVAPRI
ncbi:hypothetical protein SALBM311S_09588 [Streptomyces alboniger]